MVPHSLFPLRRSGRHQVSRQRPSPLMPAGETRLPGAPPIREQGDGVREERPCGRGWGKTWERPHRSGHALFRRSLSARGIASLLWNSDVGLLRPMETTPQRPGMGPGCELPLNQEQSQLGSSLVVRALTQISLLFPKWLVSQALGNNSKHCQMENGTPRFDSRPGLQDGHPEPSVKVPGLLLEQTWLSGLPRGCPKLGFLVVCLCRTPVLTFLLLSSLPTPPLAP